MDSKLLVHFLYIDNAQVAVARPVAWFQGLGEQNTFYGSKTFVLLYVWNIFFWAQQTVGAQKHL